MIRIYAKAIRVVQVHLPCEHRIGERLWSNQISCIFDHGGGGYDVTRLLIEAMQGWETEGIMSDAGLQEGIGDICVPFGGTRVTLG